MSTNCIVCIKRPRTRAGLLCDECRQTQDDRDEKRRARQPRMFYYRTFGRIIIPKKNRLPCLSLLQERADRCGLLNDGMILGMEACASINAFACACAAFGVAVGYETNGNALLTLHTWEKQQWWDDQFFDGIALFVKESVVVVGEEKGDGRLKRYWLQPGNTTAPLRIEIGTITWKDQLRPANPDDFPDGFDP
jgi:hypothetical protein